MWDKLGFMDNASLIVRPARDADADAVRANHMVTFREHVAREAGFAGEAPFIEAHLQRDGGGHRDLSLWVAERDGAFAGHVATFRSRIPGLRHVVQIADISVVPDQRGHGVGTALVARVEAAAAEARAQKVVAMIWPSNFGSQQMFRRLGYRVDERRLPGQGGLMVAAVRTVPQPQALSRPRIAGPVAAGALAGGIAALILSRILA